MDAAALAAEPLALLGASFATRWMVDGYLRRTGIHPHMAVEANSIAAIMEMVRVAGLVTILPEMVSQEQTGLRVVPLTPQSIPAAWRCSSAATVIAALLPEPLSPWHRIMREQWRFETKRGIIPHRPALDRDCKDTCSARSGPGSFSLQVNDRFGGQPISRDRMNDRRRRNCAIWSGTTKRRLTYSYAMEVEILPMHEAG